MKNILTDEQKIEALHSLWEHSLTGLAVVGSDGEFLAVNEQFARICQVTPAELIGKKFQDITPAIGGLEIDVRNTELLMEGKIEFYTMPKTYQFPTGHTVQILLHVVRIPQDSGKQFQLFFVNILERQESTDASPDQSETKNSTSWWEKNKGWITTVGTAIGAALAGYFTYS